jgi:hypothetical protein
MFSAAVVRGDRVAALYLVDSLLKWWGSQESQFDGHPLPEYEFAVHTLACIDDEWPAVRSSLEDLPEGDEESTIARALAAILLRRYWVDVRFVVALVLLSWTQASDCDTAFSFELAERGISDFNRVWLHLVRAQNADRRYENRLNGVVRAMFDALEPDRLGGRIFSGWGDSDMQALLTTQNDLLLAVAGGRTPFGVFTAVSAVPYWSRDLNQLEQLRQFVRQLNDALGSPGMASRLPLVDKLRMALGNANRAEDAHAALTAELNGLSTAANEARQTVFANAQVANSRLALTSSAVSSYVLGGQCKTFPIPIATTFTGRPRSADLSRVNVVNVRKGPFTAPPLESGHERSIECYNKLVGEQIASTIVEKYLRTASPPSLPNASADLFLSWLVEQVKSIQQNGGTPAILVPIQNSPAWLRQLREGPGNASDAFAFSYRRVNDAPSVIGHLGDVPIHAAPVAADACYIVPLEDFSTLSYATFDEAMCVGLEWAPESDELIRLTFLWDFSAAD